MIDVNLDEPTFAQSCFDAFIAPRREVKIMPSSAGRLFFNVEMTQEQVERRVLAALNLKNDEPSFENGDTMASFAEVPDQRGFMIGSLRLD